MSILDLVTQILKLLQTDTVASSQHEADDLTNLWLAIRRDAGEAGPFSRGQYTAATLRTLIGNFTVTHTDDVARRQPLLVALTNWVIEPMGLTIKHSRIPGAKYGLFATRFFAGKAYTEAIEYGGRRWPEKAFNEAKFEADIPLYSLKIMTGNTAGIILDGYTHFKIYQVGRWANGFPWDARTDPNHQRVFFNNVAYLPTADGSKVILYPMLDIAADEEIYARYSNNYEWHTIYANPRGLISSKNEKDVEWDTVPLSMRNPRGLLYNYVQNKMMGVSACPLPATLVPSPPSVDIADLYFEMSLFRINAMPDMQWEWDPLQELQRWQDPPTPETFARYQRLRAFIDVDRPDLVTRIASYQVKVADLNSDRAFASLVLLANCIAGPFLSATGQLYTDARYPTVQTIDAKDINTATATGRLITRNNEYFPDYAQLTDEKKRLFAYTDARAYVDPIQNAGDKYSFLLGEKGIWLKEAPTRLATALAKTYGAGKAKKQYVVAYFPGETSATVRYREAYTPMYIQFEKGAELWSRQPGYAPPAIPAPEPEGPATGFEFEAVPADNSDDEMQETLKRIKVDDMNACIGCGMTAKQQCGGCATPYCGEPCQQAHWQAIGCPCRRKGKK